MELLDGLRGWFSRSGALWRPYLDVPGSASMLAVASRPSVVASQSRLWTGRWRARPVATNDPTPGCTPPRPEQIASCDDHGKSRQGATVLCGADAGACRIHDLSIDKKSGRIDYALVAFDVFLGLSEKIYPAPWALLSYDVAANAYRIPVNASALKATPRLTPEDSSGSARATKRGARRRRSITRPI